MHVFNEPIKFKNYDFEDDGIVYNIIENDVGKFWRFNDMPHRVSGPAVEYYSGTKHWYLHGKKHRLDGPASMYHNGAEEWYFKGELIKCNSQTEFEKLLRLKAFW